MVLLRELSFFFKQEQINEPLGSYGGGAGVGGEGRGSRWPGGGGNFSHNMSGIIATKMTY